MNAILAPQSRLFTRPPLSAPLQKKEDHALDSLVLQDHSQDKDWQDAARLMADHHIPEEQHALLHENLATYLAHRTHGIPSARWQNKLDRELAKPYTDGEVMARVDFLQASLLEDISQLPAMPSQIYLTGSFSRGRLGARSDLDGYGVLSPADLKPAFKVFADRDAAETANLFPFSSKKPGYNQAMLMVAGASVKIDPSRLKEDGYLAHVYAGVQSHRPSHRRETNPVYEWVTGKLWKEGLSPQQKIDQFEGKTLKSKLFGWGLSLGGTLAMAPVIGPIIGKVADFMVTQNHQVASTR